LSQPRYLSQIWLSFLGLLGNLVTDFPIFSLESLGKGQIIKQKQNTILSKMSLNSIQIQRKRGTIDTPKLILNYLAMTPIFLHYVESTCMTTSIHSEGRIDVIWLVYLEEEFADTKWVNRSHESMARYQRSKQKSWFNGQIPKDNLYKHAIRTSFLILYLSRIDTGSPNKDEQRRWFCWCCLKIDSKLLLFGLPVSILDKYKIRNDVRMACLYRL
jgi:hypothetical protein